MPDFEVERDEEDDFREEDEDDLDDKTSYTFSFQIPENAESGTYVISALTGTETETEDNWFEINLQSTFTIGTGDEDSTEFLGIKEDSPILPIIFMINFFD